MEKVSNFRYICTSNYNTNINLNGNETCHYGCKFSSFSKCVYLF